MKEITELKRLAFVVKAKVRTQESLFRKEAVNELENFILLHIEVYNKLYKPVYEVIRKRVETFNEEQTRFLISRVVGEAAKLYAEEYAEPGYEARMFPQRVRDAVTDNLVNKIRDELGV